MTEYEKTEPLETFDGLTPVAEDSTTETVVIAEDAVAVGSDEDEALAAQAEADETAVEDAPDSDGDGVEDESTASEDADGVEPETL